VRRHDAAHRLVLHVLELREQHGLRVGAAARPVGSVVRHDESKVRAMLEQQFEYARSDPDKAHAIYHDDAVLEFPQSGERFVGVENFRE
jgi:hypothetical protein